jgi:hypothetical protein
MKEQEVPVLTLPLAIGYSVQRRLSVTGSVIMRFAPGISLTPYFADC